MVLYFIGCFISFFIFASCSLSKEGRKNLEEKNVSVVALTITIIVCTILSWVSVVVYLYECFKKIGGEK